jgi:hypothetical protein
LKVMRRKFRIIRSEDPVDIFDDLDALRQAQTAPQTIAPQRRVRLKETFARIPHDRAVELARHDIGGPAWLILIELDRLILKSRGKNPIRLTNRNLKAAKVTNHTKARALRQLEAAGVIRVVARQRGKSPLIIHYWFPLQG